MNDINILNKKFQKELKAGTVALILLGILGRDDKPMYGYQISREIEDGIEGGPDIAQGALYPVLRSLERSGLLASEVEPSVSGPPRRYYRITGLGRETLAEWSRVWHSTREYVDLILKGRDHASHD